MQMLRGIETSSVIMYKTNSFDNQSGDGTGSVPTNKTTQPS